MASAKLQAATKAAEGEDLAMDMSSMIDLVFLLLIFFMVSSHLIIITVDKNVKPPTAKNARVAENGSGRIVVNIYDDGTILDVNSEELPTQEAITDYVDTRRLTFEDSGIKIPRLHLRADKNVDTRVIKKVVQAAGEAGVNEVIFGSFVVEKD
ncbi:biopolymer transporter ExbD [Verrucomicrobiales bacterium]|jgi:biopolymer transport protein ExbD|nr:biopolymer transporter ExbD [Verrucomicrobiales bacterium]